MTRAWIEYGQYVPVPNSAANIVQYYALPTVPRPVNSLSQVNFDAAPAMETTFTNIAFSVGEFDPVWPGGPFDYAAARYVGRVFLPATGVYTFYSTSDDGSQICVDGSLVVTNPL